MSILGILAAVVPIVGSLYAAGSFLAQQAALAHEHRVRLRLLPLIEARPSADQPEFEQMMLAHNGITHPGTTWDQFDMMFKMSGERVPSDELRRQWVLLTTAVAGLILLAFDVLLS